jgi:hypothetical protein
MLKMSDLSAAFPGGGAQDGEVGRRAAGLIGGEKIRARKTDPLQFKDGEAPGINQMEAPAPPAPSPGFVQDCIKIRLVIPEDKGPLLRWEIALVHDRSAGCEVYLRPRTVSRKRIAPP